MTIGNVPIHDRLILVAGQDLLHEIRLPADSRLEVGTAVKLVIYDRTEATQLATWPASVDTDRVRWTVTSEQTDQITSPGARFRIYVDYPDDTTQCWYAGPVYRYH
ncbi:hypothetical protein [Nocardia sp. CC227C]|uniref:LtfC-like domain-containing protein n=1 Tax=Nocardia sp. CC227C TaxID=3044562 RepID=UPI00278C5044|nr:hypothetical protein [Nocardia sp. CC227C]